MEATQDTGTTTVTVDGEAWTLSVERRCPATLVAEGCVVYGVGLLLAQPAHGFAHHVEIQPEGMNVPFISLSCMYGYGLAKADRAASRWAIATGVRDESGRVSDAGRALLLDTI